MWRARAYLPLLARGMRSCDLQLLRRELMLYNYLRDIQGKYIPVCLKAINLRLPCHFSGDIFSHFLFLSWSGPPLSRCIQANTRATLLAGATTALKELHRRGVIHGDAEPRNMLCDQG